MKCDIAQQSIVLAHYGELPDGLQFQLEQHLATCNDCRREFNALIALHEELTLTPLLEPSPNLLAASRLRLDEALDELPPRSLSQHLWGNAFRWLGFIQGSPALATLLLGLGFLGGNVVVRYQVIHARKPAADVVITGPAGPIASVSGIVQTPDSGIVQVKYNRLVPEMMQGSLDDPQIRQLLMTGAKLATTNEVHADSVALLARECRAGRNCDGSGEGSDNADSDIRAALLASLRYDKSPAVRLNALTSLQGYVAQDQHVRDAVLDALLRDKSADVRAQAVSMLVPVQADSSVRQVLRTASTQDVNPAVRNASFTVLQGTAGVD
jgi:hypothetical protein